MTFHQPIVTTLSMLWLLAMPLSVYGQSTTQDPSITPQIKGITLPIIAEERLTTLRLDTDVLSGSTDSGYDLRILDEAENEVPFLHHLLVEEKTRITRVRQVVSTPQIKPLDNDGLEITFQLDKEKHLHPINGLTLITHLRDFEHRVAVDFQSSGSDEWKTVVDQALIYDYSKYMDVKNTDIAFPKDSIPLTAVAFRVRIESVTQEHDSPFMQLSRSLQNGTESGRQETWTINRQPLRIERLELWQDVESVDSTKPLLTTYPLTIDSRTENKDDKTTIIDFTSSREPLTTLTLVTSSKNFHRNAKLFALDPSSTQLNSNSNDRLIAQARLTSLDFEAAKRDELSLAFPKNRSRKYKLVIENGDSPPLSEINLKGEGEIHELLFFAQPNKKYSLTYGNELLEAPSYDQLAIETAMKLKLEPLAGELQDAVPYRAVDPRSQWDRLLANRWVIGATIVVLVTILGFGLRQAAVRLDSIPTSKE